MNDGEIYGNKAGYGGGIFLGTGNGSVTSSFTMNGGKIINNNASSNGGGIYARKDFNAAVAIYLKAGILSNNTASNGANTFLVNGAQIFDERT